MSERRLTITERTRAKIDKRLGRTPKKKAVKVEGAIFPPKGWVYAVWHNGAWHWLMNELSPVPGVTEKKRAYVICMNLYHGGGPFYSVQRTREDGTVEDVWRGMSEQKALRVCREESGKR